MQRTKRMIQTIALYSAALFLAAGYPLSAFAETTPAAAPTSTESATVDPGYRYDAATQRWDTSDWRYNSATGSYEPVVASVPPAVQTPPPTTTQPSTVSDVVSHSPTIPGTQTTDKEKTAADAAATANNETSTASVTGVTSQAQTGDATVANNTTAAHATSGNASATAVQTNVVNSSLSSGAQTPATFVSNVIGDVYGDIMLYPMMLASMLQSAVTPPTSTAVNSTTNQVVNDITLHAASGNATVSGNTTAGNATSGSANAVASVMNIVNSMVAANQSFVGTVNIYGNLNGDILVAPDFIPQLLASNAAASTPSATLASANTTSIVNNVTLGATSGSAGVAGNTSAGSATSGTATTNTVILNLTGQQVVASNSLLVFVNVLGTWIGMIVNAPAGATAAALGDGVLAATSSPQTIANQTSTQLINNITLDTWTGDATVSNNTTAGNATTGNATASAAILNIANSTLGLSNWFGVLFINVFGSWEGSFGIDTAYGNNPIQPVHVPTTRGASIAQAVAFIARAAPQVQPVRVSSLATSSVGADVVAENQTAPSEVLGATTVAASPARLTESQQSQAHQRNSAFPSALAMMLTGLGVAGAGWLLAMIRKYK